MGHCGYAVATPLDGVRVATLGAVKRMTRRFRDAYVDEACVLLAADEFNAAGTT